MIHYDEPLFRPPSEAESLIIQATLGCSYNKCTFCSMYKSKKYTIKSYAAIAREIDYLSSYSETRRVFIADGDAFSLKTEMLIKIFSKLKDTFPKLRRISLYGNTLNILHKTDSELENLYKAGLSIIYLGLESGSDLILEKINKGVSEKDQESAVLRVQKCGIDISATIITGLGGKEHWKEHIIQSAELINMSTPKYLSTLSLMTDSESIKRVTTPFETGFTPQDNTGILEEEKLLISLIDSKKRIIFRSNHASNILPLSGRLPGDKEKLIEQINAALTTGKGIRPLWMREI
ncbi:MAG: radical SAM protein [Spirochaetaceae bacterium]|nr:radical SAM protein [Spirochaetaceae bacterium]